VALARAAVAIDDLELEDFSQAARGLSYFFNIKTAAPTDKVIKSRNSPIKAATR
jgi:hypothetical protein